jgi:hypothetical protein
VADIVLVVIANISDHSGCRDSAKLKICATMDEDRNKINFRFESLVAPEEYTEKNKEIIELTRAEIDSGAYLDKVALDRRSGLFKVASIIKPNAGGRIEFGFLSPTCFFVDLDLVLTVENVNLNAFSPEAANETVTC